MMISQKKKKVIARILRARVFVQNNFSMLNCLKMLCDMILHWNGWSNLRLNLSNLVRALGEENVLDWYGTTARLMMKMMNWRGSERGCQTAWQLHITWLLIWHIPMVKFKINNFTRNENILEFLQPFERKIMHFP